MVIFNNYINVWFNILIQIIKNTLLVYYLFLISEKKSSKIISKSSKMYIKKNYLLNSVLMIYFY